MRSCGEKNCSSVGGLKAGACTSVDNSQSLFYGLAKGRRGGKGGGVYLCIHVPACSLVGHLPSYEA